MPFVFMTIPENHHQMMERRFSLVAELFKVAVRIGAENGFIIEERRNQYALERVSS